VDRFFFEAQGAGAERKKGKKERRGGGLGRGGGGREAEKERRRGDGLATEEAFGDVVSKFEEAEAFSRLKTKGIEDEQEESGGPFEGFGKEAAEEGGGAGGTGADAFAKADAVRKAAEVGAREFGGRDVVENAGLGDVSDGVSGGEIAVEKVFFFGADQVIALSTEGRVERTESVEKTVAVAGVAAAGVFAAGEKAGLVAAIQVAGEQLFGKAGEPGGRGGFVARDDGASGGQNIRVGAEKEVVGAERMREKGGVVVDVEEEGGVAFGDSAVAGVGEALLRFEEVAEAELRVGLEEGLAEDLGMIGGIVVDEEDFVGFGRVVLLEDGKEEGLEVFFAVVGANNDGNLGKKSLIRRRLGEGRGILHGLYGVLRGFWAFRRRKKRELPRISSRSRAEKTVVMRPAVRTLSGAKEKTI
jgi:hypothetical protein